MDQEIDRRNQGRTMDQEREMAYALMIEQKCRRIIIC